MRIRLTGPQWSSPWRGHRRGYLVKKTAFLTWSGEVALPRGGTIDTDTVFNIAFLGLVATNVGRNGGGIL